MVFFIKRYLAFSLLIIIIILVGCREETPDPYVVTGLQEAKSSFTKKDPIIKSNPISFKIEGQEIHIIPIIKSMQEYINEIENTDQNYRELFQSTVIEPFRKEAFGEEGGHWVRDRYSFEPPRNHEQLLESVVALDQEYENIVSTIKETLEKSIDLLPSDEFKIYLFPFNPDQNRVINQMNGVTAFATSNQLIIMHIAPLDFDEEILKYTVAHEYHHLAYFTGRGDENKDLVDYILTEGKADSFAVQVVPHFDAPWTSPLTAEEITSIWEWIQERRFTFTESDLAEMRNGNRSIPQWSDYRMGYHIMKDFIERNPQVPIEEWTFMNADKILEGLKNN